MPVGRGHLPKQVAHTVFAPPAVLILETPPRLAVELAIPISPEELVPDVRLDRIGHPFGVGGIISGRRGGPGGLGDGCCGGIGNDNGGGLEGRPAAQGLAAGRRPSVAPKLICKNETEYSEEARKTKMQGTVILAAVVDPNGRLSDIRVLARLGLGLDEKAVAAAALLRFQPAILNGKPIAYPVHIEVNFRLL